jgi:hypothetical protein
MTKKQKVKTVEICIDLHGLEFLVKRRGFSRRIKKLKTKSPAGKDSPS